jgi:hypothetical protein
MFQRMRKEQHVITTDKQFTTVRWVAIVLGVLGLLVTIYQIYTWACYGH